ncbi:spore wall synthesis complex protein [Yaniella flava]|uniref:Spore wall synthesis complex protein n=1 Tax=Yaniella flava TaxID=287930 RepID=A0ABP5G655_9MICC
MGLSDREQEAFAEIESQLISEDPKFASQMQLGKEESARRFSTRNIVLGVLTATVGIVVLLTGVTIDAIWLGIIGFVVMGGGIYLASKQTTSPPSKSSGRGGSGQQSKSNQGFMEGLESRWDERRRQ